MVGDLHMVASGAHKDNCPYVNSDLCRRDSELGQMLMTCGKLSSQSPSVKAGSMPHATALRRNC